MKKLLLLFFIATISAMWPTLVCAQEQGAWTWEEERYKGIVPQELDNSCGLAAITTIMQTHFGDDRFSEHELVKRYMERATEVELAEAITNGLSLLEIEKLVQSLGYTTAKKVLTIDELEQVVSFVPALVYLEIGKFRHFAVVRGISKEMVLLADPSRGNVEYSRDDFLSEWKPLKGYPPNTGVALIIVRNEGTFKQKLLREPAYQNPPSLNEMGRHLMMH